jgi:hypothetical protein
MKKPRLAGLAVLLLVVAPCAAHSQSDMRIGKTYDRVTDSTTWALGKTDRVLFHALGEQATCASRITVLLFDSLIDFPAGAAAIARQKLLIPESPTFRLLIDSAGVLIRTAVVGRGMEFVPLFGPAATIQYHYPVPDSLTARFRGASVVEGADNRAHRFRWDQKKLSEAPPICPLT